MAIKKDIPSVPTDSNNSNSKNIVGDVKKVSSQIQETKKEPHQSQPNSTIENNLTLGKWKNITIRATTLSPVHVGNGDVFEPTNFIIDQNILYHFDEALLIKNLPLTSIAGFTNSAERGFMALHQFIKTNKEIAKKVSFEQVKVKIGLANGYEKKLENPKAKFYINKTSKNGNKEAYIPGSSLKGAIATAYMEFLFEKDFKLNKADFSKVENLFDIKYEQIFKDFKVGDSRVIKSSSTIGYAVNRARKRENGICEPNTLSNIVETIDSESIFEIDIHYRENKYINLQNILASLTRHYLPILASTQNEFKTCSITLMQNIAKYTIAKLKPNQFLIRVGKYSGARAITVKGVRNIKVKTGERTSENLSEETTSWLFANNTSDIKEIEPFGWVLLEVISNS
jgi:CRISPR-associated protein Csm5